MHLKGTNDATSHRPRPRAAFPCKVLRQPCIDVPRRLAYIVVATAQLQHVPGLNCLFDGSIECAVMMYARTIAASRQMCWREN